MKDSKTASQKLPLHQAIIYAFGYFGVQLIAFSIGQIPQIYYVPENGVSLIAPVMIGGAVLLGGYLFGTLNALGRIVDGLVDPWIGNMSDYWRSRFGRRKPFLVAGAPLMAVFFVLFTLSPTKEPSHLNILWLAFVYPMFFLFFTIAITPYLAMIPEVTRTPSERLLVTTLQSIFLVLGTFTGVVLTSLVPEKLSFTAGASLIGILSCIPFLLVAAFVKIPDEAAMSDIAPRPSTLTQIRSALSFAPFRIYLISIVAFWFGFKMIETSARYVASHLLVGVDDAFVKILGTALGVAAICGVASYHIGKKIGKRRAMILMSVMFMVLLPFIGMIGKGVMTSHATAYALFALIGIPLSLLLVIPNSLLADIIDANNKQTGEKREALFFASQALMNKVGIAFSGVVMNFILPIGAVIDADGVRGAVGETGVRMIGPIAAIFVLIGLFVFLKFPNMENKQYPLK